MAELVLIAALAHNRVIGREGYLPWHLPADLKRFKQLTLGHTVIMGRRTWESLPGPLPRRHNVVVSTTLPPRSQPVPTNSDSSTRLDILPSLEAALQRADTPQIFIIGGGTLYAQTLLKADRLELTRVEGDYPGDVFFPPYEAYLDQQFRRVDLLLHDGFRFETYRRSPRLR